MGVMLFFSFNLDREFYFGPIGVISEKFFESFGSID